MNHLARTLIVLTIAAAAVGLASFRLGSAPEVHAAAAKGDAMAWLRADFQLNDRQFAEIKRLHDAYAPTCEEHCRRIQEATEAREALQARTDADPATVAAAERTLEQLRLECETAIATHVRKVAGLMAPEQGERYLALVLPKIASFDHRAAPDVALKQAHQH